MPTCDPRADLERLPSETLYSIARNEAAQYGDLALRILVERGTDYALRDDVAERARELVLNDPIILKKVDPASAIISLKLPGIVDVLADNSAKRAELAELVDERHASSTRKLAALEATMSSNQVAAAQALAQETTALGRAFIDAHRQLRQNFEHQVAALGSDFIANKEASEQALHAAYTTLWKYFAEQQWRLSQNYENRSQALDEKLGALQADAHAAQDRLALLERSMWRKLVDWYHRTLKQGTGY